MKLYEVILMKLAVVYDILPNENEIVCREVLYKRKIFETLRDAYDYLYSINIMIIYTENEMMNDTISLDEDERMEYREHIFFTDYDNPLITRVLLDEISEGNITNIINFHINMETVEFDDFFLRPDIKKKYEKLDNVIKNNVLPFVLPKVPAVIAKKIGGYLFSKSSRKMNRKMKRRSNNKIH